MKENTKPSLISKASLSKCCGIVMPISGFADYTEAHWNDVLEILTDAAESAGFEANMVSNADDVGIIQKRIIQNLYENPIVVCDVSGKNPNVMFELGMRLAFDKPTIIVKDDRTSYSFDTSPIEHLEYPRDLRFGKIVEFKKTLSSKITGTLERAASDAHYTPFLKNFGEFTVAKLEQKEVSGQEFILDELRSLRISQRRIERSVIARRIDGSEYPSQSDFKGPDICLLGKNIDDIQRLQKMIMKLPYVRGCTLECRTDHEHLLIRLSPNTDASRVAIDKFLEDQDIGYRLPEDKVQ
ncbi:MAG: hypothetical protein ABI147_07125 [Acidobacteriaceae bacterium]